MTGGAYGQNNLLSFLALRIREISLLFVPVQGGGMEIFMKFTDQKFIPVLFGNDINVYSVARAFYEKYKVRSKVFGKALFGPCYKSKMIDFTEIADIDTPEILLEVLNSYAKEHAQKRIIAIGCGDNYVKCIATSKEALRANVIAPYSDYDFLENLMDKEKFYALLEKHGIEFPATCIATALSRDEINVHFEPPYILKPANQVEYYKHKFDGQKKVFKLDSLDELKKTLRKVYNAGYTDHMIIQEFIPGDDTFMRVLTCYSDRNAKVKMMCLGHVLLEEHTPYGIGNHAVIITEYDAKLMESFKDLLESIGYVGFSNFDIKYDSRDNKYKAFEVNTRQGRSNFYVTGSGHNIAELIVNEYILGEQLDEDIARNEYLWMVVPKGVAFKYAPAYKSRMKRLIRDKKYVNPLFFKEDNDIERRLRLCKSQLGHFVKYHKYMK